VLASDSGFCLGHSGLDQELAETLSAAAADYSAFAARQARRGWAGAQRVAFHSDPDMLLPEWSFIPLWIDGSGYWLLLAGEPLLNNLAMVELVWSIRLAGARFAAPLCPVAARSGQQFDPDRRGGIACRRARLPDVLA